MGKVDSLTSGDYTSCATKNGQVWCWDLNTNSVITKSGKQKIMPEKISKVHGAVQVTIGNRHSCVLLKNHQIMCWGENDAGQFGTGGADEKVREPTQIHNVSNVIAVAAGYIHTCALLNSKKVVCWGYGKDERLGQPATQYQNPREM